ncbi:3-deoxy-D-manno-octulosonic acid transferase [Octadecabacter sp. R77987]|uniref:3-deoxy-D-manno-octulosonic acid transferase n=1 Tax=Octadecabacter sp. R77987 TaxID=3093874 RepID=UPI00366A6411
MARTLSLRSLIGQRPVADTPKQDSTTRPDRPKGPLIWFHVGGDGNHRTIATLAHRLASERDQATFLVTGTLLESGVTSDNPNVIFQPDPPDTQTGARAFLDHWRPDMLFWMQDILLPILLAECAVRKCPMVQLNAKNGPSLNWSGPWKRTAPRAILEKFTAVMAVDNGAAARLRRAGYNPARIEVTGALEEESIALPFNEAERNEMAALIGARPVWFATDLAAREIETIADAYQRASKRGYRLLLVVTPRDVNDSAGMAQQLRDLDLHVGVRGDGDDPHDEMQVYIADLDNEHGLWYRLAPITLMGGTLTGASSRSPFEAAALGSVVVHGPATGRHGTAYERLTAAGACRAVNSAERLAEAVGLMNTPDRVAQMAQAGWTVVTDGADVSNRVLAMIRAHLDSKGG